MWQAWRLDAFTWTWIGWIVAFVVVETWALRAGYRGTLTAHLRPLFLTAPVTWWLGVGLYGWVGLHLFAPSWEVRLLEAVRL